MILVIEAALAAGVAAAGALGRRFDGGLLSEWAGFDIGRWEARASWACLAALSILLFYLLQAREPAWLVAASALWLPLGSAAWGNAGRPLKTLLNHLSIVLHGMSVMLVPVLVSWWVGGTWWLTVVAALLTLPLYMLSNRTRVSIPWLGCHPGDPEPTAELLCGAAWSLGVLAGGAAYYFN